jgi:Mrp family chromosome partitioning ATPase
MLVAAAAALALVSPLAFDILDRRILVVGDAERALGIASAAWFVQVDDEATRVLAHDQFRRFASTLLRNQSRGARGVFGFTSVKIGGGVTAVVLDVARTLVELGSQVLVVDADSLTLDSPLGSASPGLTELLAGRATAAELVQQQTHLDTTLSVIGFGHARDTGIQRLDILREALTRWATEFDTVLVDIAPILPSADAELLIDAIGQVFLVVEAGVATKGEIARARGQLERLAPEAVGLVVNKVSLESGWPELRAQMVETITRGRFQTFMSTSYLHLQYDLLKARLHQWRTRSKR